MLKVLRPGLAQLLTPVGKALARTPLTPNMLTVIGAVGVTAGALTLFPTGHLFVGTVVCTVFVLTDMLDGALARITGSSGAFGAFLDSVFDRMGEAIVYVGLVWGTLDLGLWRPVVLAAAAMAAAFMVSYTRAKAEGLGFSSGTGMAAVGLAPREVRIVILTLGLVAAGILPGFPEDMDIPGARAYPLSALALEAALGLIAILGTITVIQRILHTRALARQQERAQATEEALERPS